MAYKHERTSARRCAAQVLYSSAIRNTLAKELIETSSFDCLEEPMSDYALTLIEGVEDNKNELDEYISEASKSWPIDRMPVTDLTILRIALFEMLHMDNIPISVSINEAVELAKDFGGQEDSPKFINGILGYISREKLDSSLLDENANLANDEVGSKD